MAAIIVALGNVVTVLRFATDKPSNVKLKLNLRKVVTGGV